MAIRLVASASCDHGNVIKTAKVYKDTDTGEYSVEFFEDDLYLRDATYFTDDLEDAIGTADLMVIKSR